MCFVCGRTEADFPQGQPRSRRARAEVGREERKEGEMLGVLRGLWWGDCWKEGTPARKASIETVRSGQRSRPAQVQIGCAPFQLCVFGKSLARSVPPDMCCACVICKVRTSILIVPLP